MYDTRRRSTGMFVKHPSSSLLHVVTVAFSVVLAAPGIAQDDQAEKRDSKQPEIVIPEIADQPTTVDPATLVHEKLRGKATVEFDGASLLELSQWIETEQELPVLFDGAALAEVGIPLGEPVSDKLNDEPVYLMLNRLQNLGLAWFVDSDVLHITTTDAANERTSTQPYPIGDLLDAGYKSDRLVDVIPVTVGGLWIDFDGHGGSLELLGDVLLVRHTDEVHRHLSGWLSAIRNHARRTFIYDPPQHERIRAQLAANVSVEFVDVPLADAIAELADQSGVDIRLDSAALREERIRDREPVSIKLADRPLETVLQVMLSELKLTWTLRDGVLWVTSRSVAESLFLTAVYDVRDLCRDDDESDALSNAVVNQTSGPWEMLNGEGGIIEFAKPGTMIIRHTEKMHAETLHLLEVYREALRSSKIRDRKDPDEEILTRYYRVQSAMGELVGNYLKETIKPETWASEQRPDAAGKLQILPGGKAYISAPVTSKEMTGSPSLAVDENILVIIQSRAAHREISELLQRLTKGDGLLLEDGMQGGGFGGGFFSIYPQRRSQENN